MYFPAELTITAILKSVPLIQINHGSEVVCEGDDAISSKLPMKYIPKARRAIILSFQKVSALKRLMNRLYRL